MAGEDKQGPAISGHWIEVDPTTLMMTTHIGELTVGKPDGSKSKWSLSTPVGGLGIIVTTDLPTGVEGAVSYRRFILPGAKLVEELAGELLGQEVG